ncbi:hypothetical protein ACFE04_013285 [Oxalis oulophora]
MHDPKRTMPEAITKPKLQKKKASVQQAPVHQFNDFTDVQRLHGSMSSLAAVHKASNSKKNYYEDVPIQLRQNPDSESRSTNEYRALRREYLLLEEVNTSLEKELRDFEDGVKSLEDEKHELLDKLVVLEGLVDPSEIQSPALR